MRILLIEDDQTISKNIIAIFNKRGLAVDSTDNIEDSYSKIVDEEYDCLILDRLLPDGDGLDLLEKIRNENIKTPVIILSALSENEDILKGLNIGSDDYLSKPFDIDILFARVKALVRRSGKSLLKPIIKIRNLEIDTNKFSVTINKKLIKLTPREYSLLEYLAYNKGKIMNRLTILNHVWDENVSLFSNTVDVHIRYLRNKIGQKGNNGLIKSVRGGGYGII